MLEHLHPSYQNYNVSTVSVLKEILAILACSKIVNLSEDSSYKTRAMSRGLQFSARETTIASKIPDLAHDLVHRFVQESPPRYHISEETKSAWHLEPCSGQHYADSGGLSPLIACAPLRPR